MVAYASRSTIAVRLFGKSCNPSRRASLRTRGPQPFSPSLRARESASKGAQEQERNCVQAASPSPVAPSASRAVELCSSSLLLSSPAAARLGGRSCSAAAYKHSADAAGGGNRRRVGRTNGGAAPPPGQPLPA